MHYRSYADLSRVITRNISRVPRDIDLILAIPRSGYLPASILALTLNKHLSDLPGFLAGRQPRHGFSRSVHPVSNGDYKHILVVDDSALTGHSLHMARREIEAAGVRSRVSYAAAFVTAESKSMVDLYFDICPFPRQFEWNIFHHASLEHACVDIDGVLCVDPTHGENDDGERYRHFLGNTRPHLLPSYPLRHLVTSRLERWRPETEAWLKAHGVVYKKLSMLDLPTAEERRRLGMHAKFKARVYTADVGAKLFIESEPAQAQEIANLSGKPVLCVETQAMCLPGKMSVARVSAASVSTLRFFARRVRAIGRRITKPRV